MIRMRMTDGVNWYKIKNWMNRAFDLLAYVCAGGLLVAALWIIGQVFFFASFSIPTDSMVPTLRPGDYVLVNKLLKGPRLFSLNDAIDHKPLEIRRLKGMGEFRRNEVLVFNFPYPERWDSIGFHVMLYYVKRCIGVPGDTVEIRDARYRVNGHDGETGYIESQRQLSRYLKSKYNVEQMERNGCYRAYPGDSIVGWNIQEFGPLYVPSQGDTVKMNHLHFVLYRRLIEWEQRKKLTEQEDGIYLDGRRIEEYVFTKNYYFMGGDNCFNSQDSRYWGLLPEEYIVGKVVRIWKAKDRQTGDIHWERVMKKIE